MTYQLESWNLQDVQGLVTSQNPKKLSRGMQGDLDLCVRRTDLRTGATYKATALKLSGFQVMHISDRMCSCVLQVHAQVDQEMKIDGV